MKKKGQALVEFVIILPIFLMLVLGVIDIGKILYTRIILEEKISDVITMYENGESSIENKMKLTEDKINLKINTEDNYLEFTLVKEVDIITPGLNFVFDNPYGVEVTRSILNE